MKGMVKRLLISLGIFGLAAIGPLVGSPAWAASCGVEDKWFHGGADVSADDVYMYWHSAGGAVYDTGRNKSNINMWLLSTEAVEWSNFSPDSLSDGEVYVAEIGVSLPQSLGQNLLFEAIFDDSWGDPRCETWAL